MPRVLLTAPTREILTARAMGWTELGMQPVAGSVRQWVARGVEVWTMELIEDAGEQQ